MHNLFLNNFCIFHGQLSCREPLSIYLRIKGVWRRFSSSRPEVPSKKDVLKNLAIFTGKHLYRGLFFNKAAGLWPTTLLKKTPSQVFPVNFAKFLITFVLIEHLRCVLQDTWGHLRMTASKSMMWHKYLISWMILRNYGSTHVYYWRKIANFD